MLLVKYRQIVRNKPVYLLSTCCNAEDRLIPSKHGLQAVKPIMINEYNLNMGGVDISDKSAYHFLSVSRATKNTGKKSSPICLTLHCSTPTSYTARTLTDQCPAKIFIQVL